MTITAAQRETIAAAGCDVRFDNLTRQLYATDASIYQIEPAGAAFPRSAKEASAVIKAAADAGISVTPRGAGTSLVGNAIGEGLIVDFSRHNRQIDNLNIDNRTVRVGSGVVLDQLNAFLKPHGFCFGPDVATSSRATLGGMIANNSSGARVPVYGTTADHVVSTEIVLVDGRIATIGANHDSLGEERTKIEKLIRTHSAQIAERMSPGLLKRWPAYGVERFLRAPNNLNEILAGSEGTLAAISSAELKISPLPREKGLGLVFFDSVTDAMQATVALLDLNPAAIEHIDRPLLDQTKGQLHFQAARDLMELDAKPCEAILIVEFYDDVAERLSILRSRELGLRTQICRDANEMNLVWSVRKAGLSLLTGRIGATKPVAFIEDAAVRPAQLPDYVRGLKSIIASLGLEASYYGHAASGLLHVRPVLDLHSAADLKKFRLVADQTSALVRQFKGSLSAEHGVGIARTEYMREQLGDELLNLMREIKREFDPKNVFNPGKIFGFAHKIDGHLRDNFERPIELPFEPRLAFAFKDRSFIGNLEQCNGCGGCRKDAPIMCPTFIATGDEIMSTRGRANIIRAALQMRVNGHDPLKSDELDAALSNCLSCKGCTPECPSNVNLALLKAEMLYARHRRDGLPLRERIFSSVDLLGRLGCAMPALANAVFDLRPVRDLMEKALGVSARRSLPHYASERFDRWFAKKRDGAHHPRGQLILWDDTFVRYHEPDIGKAAVKVLEALGFEVALAQGRQCCGRPAFSQGNLDAAAKLGKHNVDLLMSSQPLNSASPMPVRLAPRISTSQQSAPPILFLEPSCWSMFVEDYRELKIDNSEKIAARCFLFEKFIDDLLSREPDALRFENRQVKVAIHPHCHAKSILDPVFMERLVERLPGREVKLLDSGCCGMAGAFGALAEKYELSIQVAADLLTKIKTAQPDVVIASGTSCRHQINDLTGFHPKHMAELIAEAID
ncbi:MAG TPA: FAD-linked oxidase C-terminal domain-containing protein [Chthoniobacterales bacterium]|nr:FAD-linked oxidase C-terminal domain-containing protein [Chthoniobacterales bacterium]